MLRSLRHVGFALFVATLFGQSLPATAGTIGPTLWDYTCNGLQPTLVAETGIIKGTGGPDVINAVGEDVFVYANGGDDVICAANASAVYAGAGQDYVYGGGPDDYPAINGVPTLVYGGSGNDQLINGSYIYGESGDDLLQHGAFMSGGSGGDRLIANFSGALECDGGSGNDTLVNPCLVVISIP